LKFSRGVNPDLSGRSNLCGGKGIATHFLEKCWENENDKTE
jgi:hypothetical protein